MSTRSAEIVGQLVAGIIAIVGLAGALAFFVVAITLGRSRGKGWSHALARWSRLTGLLAAIGVIIIAVVALLS